MEPDGINLRQAILRAHRRTWITAAVLFPLLLLAVAGCLTSYAAGPPDDGPESVPVDSGTVSSTEPLPTLTPAITRVPHIAIRSFQTATVTATATLTPSPLPPTDTPTSAPTLSPTHTPQPTNTPAPTDTPRPTAAPVTPVPFQAYAWVDNYYPALGSVVTVYGRLFKNGRPVNGANMGATWSYTHREAYCSAYTGIDGRAACALNIDYPLPNYWVFINVVFSYEDNLYYARTAFLPDP